jgi:hypothetical protein
MSLPVIAVSLISIRKDRSKTAFFPSLSMAIYVKVERGMICVNECSTLILLHYATA